MKFGQFLFRITMSLFALQTYSASPETHSGVSPKYPATKPAVQKKASGLCFRDKYKGLWLVRYISAYPGIPENTLEIYYLADGDPNKIDETINHRAPIVIPQNKVGLPIVDNFSTAIKDALLRKSTANDGNCFSLNDEKFAMLNQPKASVEAQKKEFSSFIDKIHRLVTANDYEAASSITDPFHLVNAQYSVGEDDNALIWFPYAGRCMNFRDAEEYCANLFPGARLPSAKDIATKAWPRTLLGIEDIPGDQGLSNSRSRSDTSKHERLVSAKLNPLAVCGIPDSFVTKDATGRELSKEEMEIARTESREAFDFPFQFWISDTKETRLNERNPGGSERSEIFYESKHNEKPGNNIAYLHYRPSWDARVWAAVNARRPDSTAVVRCVADSSLSYQNRKRLVEEYSQEHPDALANIKCGDDILKTVIGNSFGSSNSVIHEDDHKDIKLKLLRGYDIGQGFTAHILEICGKTYIFLSFPNSPIVSDAIELPAEARDERTLPAGTCSTEFHSALIGFTRKSATGDSWVATNTWKIDIENLKFLPIPKGTLLCSKEAYTRAY